MEYKTPIPFNACDPYHFFSSKDLWVATVEVTAGTLAAAVEVKATVEVTVRMTVVVSVMPKVTANPMKRLVRFFNILLLFWDNKYTLESCCGSLT